MVLVLASNFELVQEAINGHQVTIFSKTWCPYCKRAKGLFAQEYKDAEVKVLECVRLYVSLLNVSLS